MTQATHSFLVWNQKPSADDKILVENMTNWIQNETVKLYVSSTLLMCPDQDMCFGDQFWRNHTFQLKIRSCFHCSCNDECFRMKNCCPWRNYLQSPNDTPSFIRYKDHRISRPSHYDNISLECRKTIFYTSLPFDEQRQGYFLISSCPDHFKNYEIVERCRRSRDYRETQPVISLSTNESFKNLDCAICNGERPAHLLEWVTRLICGEPLDVFQYRSQEQLQKAILNNQSSCILDFVPPSYLDDRVRKCKTIQEVNTKCNVTGEWDEYNFDIERGCVGDFYSPYMFCPSTLTSYTLYKNIYCAMCNVRNWTTGLMTECSEPHYVNDVTTFSALLDFRGSYSKENDQPKECPKKQIYDPLTRKCLQIMCEKGMIYENSKCVPVQEKINRHVYEVNLILTRGSNNTKLEMLQSTLYIYNEIQENFGTEMTDMYILTSKRWDPLRDSDYYIALYIELYLEHSHNRKKFIEKLIDFFKNLTELSKYFTIEFIGQSFKSQYLPKFLLLRTYNLFHHPFSDDPWYMLMHFTNQDIKPLREIEAANLRSLIAPVTLCPRVVVHKSQTKIIMTNFSLCLLDYGFCVKSEYFKESNDKGYVEVCMDQYTQGINAAYSASLKSFTEEKVLSVICLSFSSVGCLGSVIAFIIYDEVNHLHGLNVVSTSLILFLANIFYLLSLVAPLHSVLCMTVGAFIHFLWLSVMSWMTVSCFSFFRAFMFVRFTKSETHTTRKRFLWNILYSLLFPLIMVSVNILVNFLVYTNYSYGYSMYTCYISKPEMILYTFALPLAVMVILNIFMVIMTAREIKVKNSTVPHLANDRRMVLVFCRLSTLTGGAWLFGFLHQILQIQLFSYLHILITGTQGVFIFFAFAFHLITKRKEKEDNGMAKEKKLDTTLTS
ncbi:uncharacterized protein LOC134280286 [Saccostrea cucullata]|uniref:uncharacterized protein LOC134280286 n=1 Tax=Saccostrea cuccullata TaxID=36930 RepID=UPI002ED07241